MAREKIFAMRGAKSVILLLAVVMLVVGSLVGTLAYLTDTDAETNTFTVGNVQLTLDEAKVNPDGTESEGADRVLTNVYHLVPSTTYTKDPTVHVPPASADAWIFVKVENGIAAMEAAGTKGTIATQITANDWEPLEGVENVYFRRHTKADVVKNYVVFEEFTIDGTKVVTPSGPSDCCIPGGSRLCKGCG